MTAAAFTAGVPHPTSYPLYMILAHAFLRSCPWGSIAFRMNLLSALSGALAVALTFRLLMQVTHSRWASLAGALLFALGRTFWSQAVIAEHYETFTLYVPPEECNQTLHILLALTLKGRFVPARSHSAPWVDIGEVPASEGASTRLAALASP